MPVTPEEGVRRPETIIAFDYGLRRIGVAVGQSVTRSASPVGTLNCRDGIPDLGKLDAIVRDWTPSRLVVGLPVHADGSPSEMQANVEAFVTQLARYALPVVTIDERYTSVEAETALKNARAAGTRGRIRKEHIDAAAAVLIAERYLAGN